MIVSSEIIEQTIQKDGRTYVREKHVDHVGKEHFVEYLGDPALELHAIQIMDNLRQGELARLEAEVRQGIPSISITPPVYVSQEEAFRYLFEKLTTENDPQTLIKAASFIDLFTDVQIMAILGVDAGKVSAIRQQAENLKQAKALLDSYVVP